MPNDEQSIIPEGWGRIYAMADPRNPRLPVYIGRTIRTLKLRLYDHYQEAKRPSGKTRPVSEWILEIMKTPLRPIIYCLETAPIENLEERENYWIVFFRQLGKLLNKNDGNGPLGERPKMPEHQRKITAPILQSCNVKRRRPVENDSGQRFESVRDAAKISGVHPASISSSIRYKNRCSGKYWKYV